MDDDASYEQAWVDRDSDAHFEELLTAEDRCLLYAAWIECGIVLI